MEENTKQPNNTSLLNIVLAFIGLCLGFTYFLPNESVNRIVKSTFGSNPFDITVNRLILIVVSLVSFTGTLWYLSSNDRAANRKFQFSDYLPHLLIPVFTSVILAYTLSQLIRTPWWWVVFLIGLILLAIVLIGEPADLTNIENRTPIPLISLTSLSMGLYLLGLIVLRTIGPRLYVLVPIVGLASAFVALRFIGLRTDRKPSWDILIAIILILSQIAAALYYVFINALQFGLILTGCLYCLVTLSAGYQKNKRGRSLLTEPLSMLVITIILTGLTFLF